MTKYTPGPWKIGGSNKRSIFTNDKDCLMIATTEFALVKEKEANARLIATAPELLEACKLMYKAWEQLLPNLKNGVVQDYGLVLTKAPLACKEAIAKAEKEEK